MRTLSAIVFSLFASGKVLACELALILAVDVSGSVDQREFDIQMLGLAEALRDGSVSEALVLKKASVALVQWTGSSRQQVSIDWQSMESFEDVDAFADQIENAPRKWRNFSTAIGEALFYSASQFEAVSECKRRVIDVSGDGDSNEGVAPEQLKNLLQEAGITVNGLAIEASQPGLTEWYRKFVIAGPGSFAVQANDFEDYPEKIRLKLLREITKQISSIEVRKQSGKL